MRMRYLAAFCAISIWILGGLTVTAQEKKAPAKLVFQAKTGNVAFDHAAHSKREKDDCKVCHDKLFPADASAPLNYKAGMHKPAEAKQLSCGLCHRAEGSAFATAGNCANQKCHVKGS